MAVKGSGVKVNMVPFQPFNELEQSEHRIHRFVRENGRLSEVVSWMPSADVYEKDINIVVKMDLPGVKWEDIDVSIVGNELTIKGEKAVDVGNNTYYCSECQYGSFYRSIPLPFTPDPSKIEASYANGVLDITIPKPPESRPKKVHINVD